MLTTVLSEIRERAFRAFVGDIDESELSYVDAEYLRYLRTSVAREHADMYILHFKLTDDRSATEQKYAFYKILTNAGQDKNAKSVLDRINKAHGLKGLWILWNTGFKTTFDVRKLFVQCKSDQTLFERLQLQ